MKKSYKRKVYSEMIAGAFLIIIAITGLIYSFLEQEVKISVVMGIVFIVGVGAFIYYLRKAIEIRRTFQMYQSEDFFPSTFYQFIMSEHFKDRLSSKLKLEDCNVNSTYEESRKEVFINFEFSQFMISLCVAETEVFYYVQMEESLEGKLFDRAEAKDGFQYTEEEILEILYSDEQVKVLFSSSYQEENYNFVLEYIKLLKKKIDEMIHAIIR